MNMHFCDYYWKAGKPYGRDKVNFDQPASYKIIADPYYKRICVEKYAYGKFTGIVYDSLLLDFRHLQSPDHLAWQREILKEEKDKTVCLLRNQDDRVIFLESLYFEGHLCRSCILHSVHGVHLSTHSMYYESLQDSFNGVILYDIEKRPVMKKSYTVNTFTGEFEELILEEWDMSHVVVGV